MKFVTFQYEFFKFPNFYLFLNFSNLHLKLYKQELEFRVNLDESPHKKTMSETDKIKEMKSILKTTINNVSSIRNSSIENSEFQVRIFTDKHD